MVPRQQVFTGLTPSVEVNVRALQFVVPADRVKRRMYFSQFMGHLRLIVNQFEHQPIAVVGHVSFGQEFGIGVRGQMLEAMVVRAKIDGAPRFRGVMLASRMAKNSSSVSYRKPSGIGLKIPRICRVAWTIS